MAWPSGDRSTTRGPQWQGCFQGSRGGGGHMCAGFQHSRGPGTCGTLLSTPDNCQRGWWKLGSLSSEGWSPPLRPEFTLWEAQFVTWSAASRLLPLDPSPPPPLSRLMQVDSGDRPQAGNTLPATQQPASCCPVVLWHCIIGFALGCICIPPTAPRVVRVMQQHPPYKPNGATPQHDGTARRSSVCLHP